MKKILRTLLLLTVPLSVSAQGTLVEDTIILHLTYDDIDALFEQNGIPVGILSTDYEVDVHRIIYNTPDQHGQPTTASGLVFIPSNDTCAMPMLSYLHGTKIKKDDTFYYLRGEWWLGVLTATSGYAVCLPDYLGLGAGPGLHPYQHSESEATASIDIMRSLRIICEQESRELNGQMFLIGYSQGGHAVLATHRKIQEELLDEFTVTASAPGSGPYDMSGSQLEMVAAIQPYSVPGYLPFLMQSYQDIYGNLYDSLQQIYVPPYDVTLPPLLLGNNSMEEINQAMPEIPRDIIQPEYADAFFSDTTHPAYLALKANDVYEWIPQAPVMFNYCRSDEQVTYLNTLVAVEYMNNAGATNVVAIERDSVIGHFECAEPSIIFSKFWFDGMAELCASALGLSDSERKQEIQMFPNPVSNGVVRFTNETEIAVRVTDVQGRQIVAKQTIGPSGKLDLTAINPGILFITIEQEQLVFTRRLIVR